MRQLPPYWLPTLIRLQNIGEEKKRIADFTATLAQLQGQLERLAQTP